MRNNIRFFLSLFIILLVSGTINAQASYHNDIKQAAIALYSSFTKMQNISGRLNLVIHPGLNGTIFLWASGQEWEQVLAI